MGLLDFTRCATEGCAISKLKFRRKSRSLLVIAFCACLSGTPLSAQTFLPSAPTADTLFPIATAPVTEFPNSPGSAQSPSAATNYKSSGCDISDLKTCLKDFLGDQAGIWTSPFRLQPRDAIWILPLAGATAASLHYDARTLQAISPTSNRLKISSDLSNAGAYGAIGAAGATYLIGKLTHNEVARQTGVLSLEAIADASVVTEVLKLATNRERPYMGPGTGRFWPDGQAIYTTNGSFPSEHATIVWAFSRIVTEETPGKRWLHLALYAAATGVSVARVTSRNHFPSDVVVGSAIGYLVGGYVYRRDSDLYNRNSFSNSFSVSPAYDPSSHSYGLSISVDPNQLTTLHFSRLLPKRFLIARQ